jgi:EAL domain-containing protein (putative c-di-GMP-specific phosphodiesterase class I)
VRVLLDDFGTGFSSLTHLQRYAIDGVKIDRSFVATLEASETDRAIVSGVATIATGMGLEIIAEGVETDAQAAMLVAFRVPRAQGYAFAPALPLDDALTLLRRGTP